MTPVTPPAIIERMEDATPGACYVLKVVTRVVSSGFYTILPPEPGDSPDAVRVLPKVTTERRLVLVPVGCPNELTPNTQGSPR